LIDFPEQWRRLKDDPGLGTAAADEIVRWVSPVMGFKRTATRDTELSGQPIKANDKLIMYYSSANFDESVFENPYTFDVGRDPNPHVGFGGGGPHFCLGRHLARLQIETMLRVLADRVDRIELAAPPVRLRSFLLNGFVELPVRL
nr:cytochrome P450 [Micromonospora sp. DSM 115978]